MEMFMYFRFVQRWLNVNAISTSITDNINLLAMHIGSIIGKVPFKRTCTYAECPIQAILQGGVASPKGVGLTGFACWARPRAGILLVAMFGRYGVAMA